MLAVLLLVCFPARAQSQHQVYFAGHGFDAQCDQIGTKFKHLSTFLGVQCGESALSEPSQRFARQILGKLPAASGNLSVVTDGLGSLGAGDNATVLALVFDREMTHVEQVGRYTRLLVAVSAQVIAFDFNGMTVVWSKPVSAQYNDVYQSEQDIADALNHLLFSTDENMLLAQFARSMADYNPARATGLRLGVEEVTIAPGLWRQNYPAGVEDFLASKFTWTLASNLGVSVVPPARTDAIDNKMAARMADGAVYTLSVPESDYPVRISVDDLKKVEYDRTDIEVINVFGTYVTFDFGVRQAGDNRIRSLYSEQLKRAVGQRLPVTAVLAQSSDALAYLKATENLFDSFTNALKNPSREWANDHVVSTKSARKAIAKLNDLKEIVDKCR